jgi:alkylation response protein AidB-like acyl-CoA dehydrogenase
MEVMDKSFLIELTENQLIIKDTVRDFAEKNIRPFVMDFDETQKFPEEIIKQLGELGFLGILVPENYGGAGLGYIEFALVVEELAKIDPSISLSVAAHNGLCTNHIYQFGNEEQKNKYLPQLTSGNIIGAWGLTESVSGSDASGLKTTAVKDGDYFIINGSKTFTTHGTVGGIIVIMAITDKSKEKKGISAFILEKGMDGLIIGKKRINSV